MDPESDGGDPADRSADPSNSEPSNPRTDSSGDPGAAGPARARWMSFAELLGLTSLAVAQPVLSVFGNDASAFVSYGASSLDIIAFALIVVLAPPVGLWIVEQLIGLFGDGPRRVAHLGFIALLVVIFLSRVFPPGIISVVLLLGAAVGATVLVARTTAASQFLRYLAFSPLLFLALFLGFSPVGSLVFGSDPQAEGSLGGEDLPPILIIVLDELPTNSLLDGEGNIDADAYPGLGGLAADATFARNHTTLAPNTPIAVPTILTGLVPDEPESLPTAQSHPTNLFTLLGDDYEARASEHITQMCPSDICETPPTDPSRPHPLSMLLRQVPDVFTASTVFFNLGFEEVEPADGFEWLTESVGVQDGEPTLNYLHSLLPHQNWQRLPGGQTYEAPNPPPRSADQQSDEVPARTARQRHLLQLAYTDELVGGVLDDLRDAGVYDDTLIIVTADHGVSFRPDEPYRPLSEDNINDIMWTPLLIKEPGQTEPRVIDSPTASIDVVPTIIDLLGADIDVELDGQSVFGPARPADWKPRSLSWDLDEIEASDDGFVYADGPAGYAELLESQALDFGAEWDLRFWRWGDNGDLVGRRVSSFEDPESSGLTVSLDAPERFDDVDTAADSLPVYVSGHLEDGHSETVAVAVNGVIGGWYDTPDAPGNPGEQTFQVLIPPSLLEDGANDIEVFLIEGTGDQRRLIRIEPTESGDS